MKIGFAICYSDLHSEVDNKRFILDLVGEACEKGADLVLTPEDATYDRKIVENYWKSGKLVSTEEQLESFQELAKKFDNTIGIGFTETTKKGIFSSYALVSGNDFSIRHKAIDANDWNMYLDDGENQRIYQEALKPNGEAKKIKVENRHYDVLPLICCEVSENKTEILPSPKEADIIVVPSYGLSEYYANRHNDAYFLKEGLLKEGGAVAYCEGGSLFAKIHSKGSKIFEASSFGAFGVYVAEVNL